MTQKQFIMDKEKNVPSLEGFEYINIEGQEFEALQPLEDLELFVKLLMEK